MPRSAAAKLVARAPIAFTPRKSSHYFLLEQLMERFQAASFHSPRSTFLWSGGCLKSFVKATTFLRGLQLPAHLSVQAVAQNPFPGF